MVLLGVDIGTSSLKLGAVDAATGAFLGWSESRYDLEHPRPGWSQLPGETYFDAFRQALATLGKRVDLKRVKALCVSSQGQTFVPVDRAGRCLQEAWTWIDGRADAEAAELTERFGGEEIFQRVGLDAVYAGCFAAMIMYLRRRHEDVYARTWKFLHCSSYLIHRLTGQTAWDANIASMACLYDWRKRRWWREMLDAVGVDVNMLPEVVPSGTVVGEVHRESADELGLPVGALVVSGANDQTANAVGAGLNDESKILIVLGTALIAFKMFARGGLPEPGGYHGICSVYPVPGTSYQLGYTNSGCGTFDWCKRLLAPEAGYEEVFDRIAEAPIGSDGVMSLIDLDGRAFPVNSAYRGVLAGLSRKSDRWAILRAVAEGIGFGTRELVEIMGWDLGGKVVRVVGGAAQSDVWTQMIADILAVPLQRLRHEQSGVAGSALMAGVAVGIFQDYANAVAKVVQIADAFTPDATRQKEYEELYHRFLRLRRSADGFYA